MRRNEETLFRGARNFSDDDAAEQYGNSQWSRITQALPNRIRESLSRYSAFDFRRINALLRRGGQGDQDTLDQIADIDQAMRPISEDVVVTRGTGLHHMGVHPSQMSQATQGFWNAAYMSTSVGPVAGSYDDGGGVLHLRVPAGTPAVWVNNTSSAVHERELLLGRGFNYRVHDAVYYMGTWHLYAEITPPATQHQPAQRHATSRSHRTTDNDRHRSHRDDRHDRSHRSDRHDRHRHSDRHSHRSGQGYYTRANETEQNPQDPQDLQDLPDPQYPQDAPAASDHATTNTTESSAQDTDNTTDEFGGLYDDVPTTAPERPRTTDPNDPWAGNPPTTPDLSALIDPKGGKHQQQPSVLDQILAELDDHRPTLNDLVPPTQFHVNLADRIHYTNPPNNYDDYDDYDDTGQYLRNVRYSQYTETQYSQYPTTDTADGGDDLFDFSPPTTPTPHTNPTYTANPGYTAQPYPGYLSSAHNPTASSSRTPADGDWNLDDVYDNNPAPYDDYTDDYDDPYADYSDDENTTPAHNPPTQYPAHTTRTSGIPTHNPFLSGPDPANPHNNIAGGLLELGLWGIGTTTPLARMFTNDNDAIQYGRDHWDPYVQTLPPDVANTVTQFTAPGSYRRINTALRDGTPLDTQTRTDVRRMDQALAGNPVTEYLVATRGTGINHLPASPQEMVERRIPFTETGFVSTALGSPAPSFDNNDAILYIRVPPGTPAIWMERLSTYGVQEREFVLARNITWTPVDAVQHNGQWHMMVEIDPASLPTTHENTANSSRSTDNDRHRSHRHDRSHRSDRHSRSHRHDRHRHSDRHSHRSGQGYYTRTNEPEQSPQDLQDLPDPQHPQDVPTASDRATTNTTEPSAQDTDNTTDEFGGLYDDVPTTAPERPRDTDPNDPWAGNPPTTPDLSALIDPKGGKHQQQPSVLDQILAELDDHRPTLNDLIPPTQFHVNLADRIHYTNPPNNYDDYGDHEQQEPAVSTTTRPAPQTTGPIDQTGTVLGPDDEDAQIAFNAHETGLATTDHNQPLQPLQPSEAPPPYTSQPEQQDAPFSGAEPAEDTVQRPSDAPPPYTPYAGPASDVFGDAVRPHQDPVGADTNRDPGPLPEKSDEPLFTSRTTGYPADPELSSLSDSSDSSDDQDGPDGPDSRPDNTDRQPPLKYDTPAEEPQPAENNAPATDPVDRSAPANPQDHLPQEDAWLQALPDEIRESLNELSESDLAELRAEFAESVPEESDPAPGQPITEPVDSAADQAPPAGDTVRPHQDPVGADTNRDPGPLPEKSDEPLFTSRTTGYPADPELSSLSDSSDSSDSSDDQDSSDHGPAPAQNNSLPPAKADDTARQPARSPHTPAENLPPVDGTSDLDAALVLDGSYARDDVLPPYTRLDTPVYLRGQSPAADAAENPPPDPNPGEPGDPRLRDKQHTPSGDPAPAADNAPPAETDDTPPSPTTTGSQDDARERSPSLSDFPEDLRDSLRGLTPTELAEVRANLNDTEQTDDTSPSPTTTGSQDDARERMHHAETRHFTGARTFSTDAAAADYGADTWNTHARRLPHPQWDSLRWSAESVHGPAAPRTDHHIANIDAALSDQPIPHDTVVTYTPHPDTTEAERNRTANTAVNNAFLPAQLGRPNDTRNDAPAIVHLRVPAGTPAIWMPAIDPGSNPRDILIQRHGRTEHTLEEIHHQGTLHRYAELVPTPATTPQNDPRTRNSPSPDEHDHDDTDPGPRNHTDSNNPTTRDNTDNPATNNPGDTDRAPNRSHTADPPPTDTKPRNTDTTDTGTTTDISDKPADDFGGLHDDAPTTAPQPPRSTDPNDPWANNTHPDHTETHHRNERPTKLTPLQIPFVRSELSALSGRGTIPEEEIQAAYRNWLELGRPVPNTTKLAHEIAYLNVAGEIPGLRGGAEGLEAELPNIGLSLPPGTTVDDFGTLVDAPEFSIVLDVSHRGSKLEIVSKPFAVVEGDVGKPSADQVHQAVRDAVRRLASARNRSRLEQIFADDRFSVDPEAGEFPLRKYGDHHHDQIYAHYSAGIPLAGMPRFMAYVSDSMRTGGNKSAARSHLRDAMSLAHRISGEARDAYGFSRYERKELEGFLALTYSQFAAIAERRYAEVGWAKELAALNSRVEMWDARQSLSPQVQAYLHQSSRDLSTRFAKKFRSRMDEGASRPGVGLLEKRSAPGKTLGDYLNGAFSANPTRPVSQYESMTIRKTMDMDDNAIGGVPQLVPPALVVELRMMGESREAPRGLQSTAQTIAREIRASYREAQALFGGNAANTGPATSGGPSGGWPDDGGSGYGGSSGGYYDQSQQPGGSGTYGFGPYSGRYVGQDYDYYYSQPGPSTYYQAGPANITPSDQDIHNRDDRADGNDATTGDSADRPASNDPGDAERSPNRPETTNPRPTDTKPRDTDTTDSAYTPENLAADSVQDGDAPVDAPPAYSADNPVSDTSGTLDRTEKPATFHLNVTDAAEPDRGTTADIHRQQLQKFLDQHNFTDALNPPPPAYSPPPADQPVIIEKPNPGNSGTTGIAIPVGGGAARGPDPAHHTRTPHDGPPDTGEDADNRLEPDGLDQSAQRSTDVPTDAPAPAPADFTSDVTVNTAGAAQSTSNGTTGGGTPNTTNNGNSTGTNGNGGPTDNRATGSTGGTGSTGNLSSSNPQPANTNGANRGSSTGNTAPGRSGRGNGGVPDPIPTPESVTSSESTGQPAGSIPLTELRNRPAPSSARAQEQSSTGSPQERQAPATTSPRQRPSRRSTVAAFFRERLPFARRQPGSSATPPVPEITVTPPPAGEQQVAANTSTSSQADPQALAPPQDQNRRRNNSGGKAKKRNPGSGNYENSGYRPTEDEAETSREHATALRSTADRLARLYSTGATGLRAQAAASRNSAQASRNEAARLATDLENRTEAAADQQKHAEAADARADAQTRIIDNAETEWSKRHVAAAFSRHVGNRLQSKADEHTRNAERAEADATLHDESAAESERQALQHETERADLILEESQELRDADSIPRGSDSRSDSDQQISRLETRVHELRGQARESRAESQRLRGVAAAENTAANNAQTEAGAAIARANRQSAERDAVGERSSRAKETRAKEMKAAAGHRKSAADIGREIGRIQDGIQSARDAAARHDRAARDADRDASNIPARDDVNQAEREAAEAERKASDMEKDALPREAQLGYLLRSGWYRTAPIDEGQLRSLIDSELHNIPENVRENIKTNAVDQARSQSWQIFQPNGFTVRSNGAGTGGGTENGNSTENDGSSNDEAWEVTFNFDPDTVYRHNVDARRHRPSAQRFTQSVGAPSQSNSYTGSRGGGKSFGIGVLATPFYIGPSLEIGALDPSWLDGIRAVLKFSFTFRARANSYGANNSATESATIELNGPAETYEGNLSSTIRVKPPRAEEYETNSSIDVSLVIPDGPVGQHKDSPASFDLQSTGNENISAARTRVADQSQFAWSGDIKSTDEDTPLHEWVHSELGFDKPKSGFHPFTWLRTKLGFGEDRYKAVNLPTYVGLADKTIVGENLSKMTYGSHDVENLVDSEGNSQTLSIKSTPTTYTRMPNPPKFFDTSLTTSSSSGISISKSKSSSWGFVTGLGYQFTTPDRQGRFIPAMLEGMFQHSPSKYGDTAGESGSESRMFWGSPDSSMYRVERTYEVRLQGGQTQTFTGITYEVLADEDARLLATGDPSPTGHPGSRQTPDPDRLPPFEGLRGDRPADFWLAKPRSITYSNNSPVSEPQGDSSAESTATSSDDTTPEQPVSQPDTPGKPYTEWLAEEMIKSVANRFPGLVVPDLDRVKGNFAKRPNGEWTWRQHRPFKREFDSAAIQNTIRIRQAVSKASLKGNIEKLHRDGIPIQLLETNTWGRRASHAGSLDWKLLRPNVVTIRLSAEFGRLQHAGESERSTGVVTSGVSPNNHTTGSGKLVGLFYKILGVYAGDKPDASGALNGYGLVHFVNPGISRSSEAAQGQGLQESASSTLMFDGKSDLWLSDVTFTMRLDDNERYYGDTPVRERGEQIGPKITGRMELATPQVPESPANARPIELRPKGNQPEGEARRLDDAEAENFFNSFDGGGLVRNLMGLSLNGVNTGANRPGEYSLLDHTRSMFSKHFEHNRYFGLRKSYTRKFDLASAQQEAMRQGPENYVSEANLMANLANGTEIRPELSGGVWSHNTIRPSIRTESRVDAVKLTPYKASGITDETSRPGLNDSTTVSWTASAGSSHLPTGNWNSHDTDPDSTRGDADKPGIFSGITNAGSKTLSSKGNLRTESYERKSSFTHKADSSYLVEGSGLIRQVAEFARQLDNAVTLYRPRTYKGWQVRFDKLFTGNVHAWDGLASDLVRDRLNDDNELQTRDLPQNPKPLRVRFGLGDTGTSKKHADAERVLTNLKAELSAKELELTGESKRELRRALSSHLANNPNSNVPVPVNVRHIHSSWITSRLPWTSRPSATAMVHIRLDRNGGQDVDYSGGLTTFREDFTWTGSKAKVTATGGQTSTGFGGFGPMYNNASTPSNPDSDDNRSEPKSEAVLTSGTQPHDTTYTSGDSKTTVITEPKSRNVRIALNTPYARVGTGSDLSLDLTFISDKGGIVSKEDFARGFSAKASAGKEHRLYPASYLNTDADERSDRPESRPQRVVANSEPSVAEALRKWTGPDGKGQGDSRILPVALADQGQGVRDLAHVVAASARGWTPPEDAVQGGKYTDGAIKQARDFLADKLGLNPRSNAFQQALNSIAMPAHFLSADEEGGLAFPAVGKTDWGLKHKPNIETARILHVAPNATVNDSRTGGISQTTAREHNSSWSNTLGGIFNTGSSHDDGHPSGSHWKHATGTRDRSNGTGDSSTTQPTPPEELTSITEGPLYLVEMDTTWAISAKYKSDGATRIGETDSTIIAWVPQADAEQLGILNPSDPERAEAALDELSQREKELGDAEKAYLGARREVWHLALAAQDAAPGAQARQDYREKDQEVQDRSTAYTDALRAWWDAEAQAVAAASAKQQEPQAPPPSNGPANGRTSLRSSGSSAAGPSGHNSRRAGTSAPAAPAPTDPTAPAAGNKGSDPAAQVRTGGSLSESAQAPVTTAATSTGAAVSQPSQTLQAQEPGRSYADLFSSVLNPAAAAPPAPAAQNKTIASATVEGKTGEPTPQPPAPRPTPPRTPGEVPARTVSSASDGSPEAGPGGSWHGSFDGIEDLVRSVESGISERTSLSNGGGFGETVDLIRFANGMQAIYKRTEGSTVVRIIDGVAEDPDVAATGRADAEYLASLVGRAVGATVPGVYRTGRHEFYMHLMDGTPGSVLRDGPRPQLTKNNSGIRLGVMDALIANSDRHSGNWLLTDDGTVVGIDHGAAWDGESGGSPDDYTSLDRIVANGTLRTLYNFEAKQWIPNLLTERDAARLESRITRLRPEFVRIGRERWFDSMMARLRMLKSNAKGTDDILPGELP
ncbi:ADP-ribosyltransferase [Streptomonospora sediminis]